MIYNAIYVKGYAYFKAHDLDYGDLNSIEREYESLRAN